MELNRKKLNKIYFHHDKFNREVTHKRRSCFVTADADFDYVSSDDEYTSSSSEEVTCTGSGCRSLNLKNAVEQGEEEHPAFHQHKVHKLEEERLIILTR